MRREIMHRDRGSILLFVLFSILVLTALVYHVFTPYRQTIGETQAMWVRDRGLSYLYSLENVAQSLLPRVDLNLYRQLKRVPAGEPVVITLPVPEGVTTAELSSENNCLNITLDTPPGDGQRQQLAQLMLRLSSLVVHETDSGKLAMDALYPQNPTSDTFLGQDNFLEQGDTAVVIPVPHQLSASQQKSLALLQPYLCRLATAGQYIDVNAIDTRSLVVLQTLLPPEIQSQALEQLYAKRGNNYWDDIDKYIRQLPHPELVTTSVKARLHTESQAFTMKFSFDSQAGAFWATTHFALRNRQLTVIRRDIITRDSL